MKTAYQDIESSGCVRHITADGESSLTDKQLAYLKDLWRMSDSWHPVDSLFLIIPEIEKHFSRNVLRLMMAYDMKDDEAIQIVGSIIFDGTIG